MADKPRYVQVYNEIKKAIQDGIYTVGTMIPTEMQLCGQYDVSRTTIRKALSILVADGYIRIKQGKGTEVLDLSTAQRLGNISSITETLKEKGYDVYVGGMLIQTIKCPSFLTESLQLTVDDDVFLVERLILADCKPVAYIRNHLVKDCAPDLDAYSGRFISLYHFLESKYNIMLTDAEESITAVSADFTDSNLLGVPVGAPLLHSKRITYSHDRPIDRSEAKLVADRYEYKIKLHGR